MSLNKYAAERRLAIFDDLRAGRDPAEGAYDEGLLRTARSKGQPQMGATDYAPDAIRFEFIYPDPKGASVILVVTLAPPERIVYMPVPEWVVESIWQGEIAGSAHFESDAKRMLSELHKAIESEFNAEMFVSPRAIARGQT